MLRSVHKCGEVCTSVENTVKQCFSPTPKGGYAVILYGYTSSEPNKKEAEVKAVIAAQKAN